MAAKGWGNRKIAPPGREPETTQSFLMLCTSCPALPKFLRVGPVGGSNQPAPLFLSSISIFIPIAKNTKMEFVKPAAEKLTELNEILEGYIHRKRAAISDGSSPNRVAKEIENLRIYIDRCNKQIAALENRRDNWKDIVDECDTRIAELRLEIDGLKGVAKPVITATPEQQLAEIAKLAQQLGITQAELEIMMAQSLTNATDTGAK